MRRIPRLGMAVLAALICSCSLFDYSGVTVKKYALVYGVTGYIYPLASNMIPDGSPNLTYPHLDAQDMSSLLEGQGYEVKSRWVDGDGYVWVDGVRGSNIDVDGSEAPTESVIKSDLSSLTATIGSTDQFLFYFSGHGMQDTSTSPSIEYIVPSGGIITDTTAYPGYTAYYGDLDSSISDAEMGGYLSEYIKTSRKIVILDTCRSGGFIDNSLEADATPSTTDPKVISLATVNTLAEAIKCYAAFSSTSASGVSPYNAAVLSAAGADEDSYDDGDKRHGAMTYYLLKTPTYADLNGDGAITVREAFAYVKAAIEENWNKDYPSYAFTPHVSGGPVDWVLY
jgi:hypothetical protein